MRDMQRFAAKWYKVLNALSIDKPKYPVLAIIDKLPSEFQGWIKGYLGGGEKMTYSDLEDWIDRYIEFMGSPQLVKNVLNLGGVSFPLNTNTPDMSKNSENIPDTSIHTKGERSVIVQKSYRERYCRFTVHVC